MINNISKTLEAQEKTQDIKQSPSMKIGTKLDARSRRNELTEVIGRSTVRWRKATRRSDQRLSNSSSNQTMDWTLAANRPDAGQQRPIEYREVPERRTCDQTCSMASDRTLAASDQLFTAPTVGTTGRVRSGRLQHPVSSRKARLRPQRLLSQWGL